MTKELIYNPFTNKTTRIDPTGRTARRIYKYLIETGSEPQDILPQNLTYINGRFRRVNSIVDFSNVRRITKGEVDAQDPRLTYLKNIVANYIGQTIRRIRRYPISIPGTEQVEMVEDDILVEIPTNFSSWWKKSYFFFLGSDTFIFDLDGGKPEFDPQVLILSYDKVDAEDTNQYFLDGVSHCFFQPIKDWAIECYEEAKSKQARSRYRTINKNIDKYTEQYASGVPTEDIQAIVDKLQIKVEIDVPTALVDKNTEYICCESSKKHLKNFKFINTRLNHIELNKISICGEYEEVDDIESIAKELRSNNEFFLWKQDASGNITQINTLQNKYKKKSGDDDYSSIVKDFEEKYGIQKFKIEHFSNPELSEFLLENVNSNQSIKFRDSPKLYKHIDMNRAYTRGDECTYYQGYLGKITDFRKCDKIMGLGIYNIENVVIDNPALEKMNYILDDNAYPSPELEFFRQNGVTFDITHGCWGSKFDMKFDEAMKKRDNPMGPRHYSKWWGCCHKLSTKHRYLFDCKNLEFAKLAQYGSNCDIHWNYEDESAMIQYQKTHTYHASHIAAFITSYCRITMMEQIMRFKDLDNIKGVVVDGIYYNGEDDLEISPLFSVDEPKVMNFEGSSGYLSYNHNYQHLAGCLGEKRENNRIELHRGGGGCGKTHSNIIDKGLVAPLYLAPSWKLSRNKNKEYGIDCNVIHSLICRDGQKWRGIEKYYNTLIIDEVSMMNDSHKKLIINKFPHHKIIFCGDIGFQLPPVEGKEFQITDDIVVIEDKYKHNYRCKCDKLQSVIDDLRDRLSKKQYLFNNNREEYYGKFVQEIDSIDYNIEDLIITFTNWAAWESPESYTSRYKNLNKWLIDGKSRDYSRGEIVIGPKPKQIQSNLRHAFTIHSIQGETATDKLFIDLDKMCDLRMFYTAISRAQYWDQIVFIKNSFKQK
tara:strand:+ start:4796 stop:7591 length:2796 start_codon:yes stop_codon:yes gene_type:complete